VSLHFERLDDAKTCFNEYLALYEKHKDDRAWSKDAGQEKLKAVAEQCLADIAEE